jgi:Arc/MetJ family transcription regulator
MEAEMRTNIEIDVKLMKQAQEILGTKTKRETVDRLMSDLVRRHNQLRIRELRGIGWEGNLDEWRRD